ncbi:MAG: hypothetical protein KC418_21350 [Anaerolineales bacterium]|nr:hypothetical protein [Anaerolineales bacterium]MCB8952115.1 hypothetical protein [Ardenticatenales bacterium]
MAHVFDEEDAGITTITEAVIRTVAYADVFDFPLRAGEIHRYLVGPKVAASTINNLLSNGHLVPAHLAHQDEYFTLPGRENIVQTRRQRAAAAAALWPLTIRYGQLIARLPFVRMVAVTGSLAVNNADAHADLDYLIVTANDRVWLARAAIILLVRLARRRHRVELCPNFVVSERALTFPQTLYNAREIAQMVPLAGMETYARLRERNAWTASFLPNARGVPDAGIPPLPTNTHTTRLTRLAEHLLASSLGNALEKWEMRRKIRKFSQLTTPGSEANFTADWCKGHFQDHSQRIMNAYQQRIRE